MIVLLVVDRPPVDIIHIFQALHRFCFRSVLNIVTLIFQWDSLRAIFCRWVNVTLIIGVIAILIRSVTLLVSLILISQLSLKKIIVVRCITIHLIVYQRITVDIKVLVLIITALLAIWRIPYYSWKVSILFILSWLVDIWLFIQFVRPLKK